MAGGFFGGVAQGMENQQKLAQARDEADALKEFRSRGLDLQSRGLDQAATRHADDVSLRQRGLGLQEQAQKHAQSRGLYTRADKAIDDAFSVITETVTAGFQAGRDPGVIAKAIVPMVSQARSIAEKSGRDPSMIDVRVNTLMARPTAAEVATGAGITAGTAKATSAIAETRTLEAAGMDAGVIKDPKDKIAAEGKLRDDYLEQATNFTIIRDAKNRLDAIGETGAGDVALVFQYMKVLDPGSTVREGEFATASQAAGVPAHIIGLYNKAVGGGVLAPKARKEIRQEAENMYQKSALQHDKLTTSFANIAKRQKLNVDNVIVDLSPAERSAGARVKDAFGGMADIPPPPPGFQIVR